MTQLARRIDISLWPLVVAPVLVAITYLAFRLPLLAVALAYAIAYSVVTWRRPGIALMLAFAGAPFQNDLSAGGPARFSIAEINLALMFGVLVVQAVVTRRRLTVGPLAIPVALFLGVNFLASFQTFRGMIAVTALLQMLLYLVAAVMLYSLLPRTTGDLTLPLYGLVGVGVLFALVGLASGSNYYLGMHKNGIGASLACATIVCVDLWFSATDWRRRRLLTVALLVISAALLLTLSRGAWIGALSGIVLIALGRRQFRLLAHTAILVAPVIVLAWTSLPQEKREAVTRLQRTEHNSIDARLDSLAIAKEHFDRNPWIGDGVGLRKTFDATNVVAVTLAETGIAGLVTFLLLHLVFFRMVWWTRAVLPRESAFYSLALVGAALVLSKLVHGCVDQYWSRGHLMIAWSGAGMATCAYYAARVYLKQDHGEEAA